MRRHHRVLDRLCCAASRSAASTISTGARVRRGRLLRFMAALGHRADDLCCTEMRPSMSPLLRLAGTASEVHGACVLRHLDILDLRSISATCRLLYRVTKAEATVPDTEVNQTWYHKPCADGVQWGSAAA